MDALMDRLRGVWDGLNVRERTMLLGLGLVFGVLVLVLPLILITAQNQSIEEESEDLRTVLANLEEHRAALLLLADARKTAQTRYTNATPPLGSFLEAEAKKHGLSLFEVTEQPEKTEGTFHRRAVRAGINDVGLTGIMNLMYGIVTSPHPVAIDHVQIEHPQSGDKYRLKLGVLTFDRKGLKPTAKKEAGG